MASSSRTRCCGLATTLVLQMEVPAEQTAALIARARSARVRVVLNLAPAAALAEDALRAVDVLVVNQTEGRGWLSTSAAAVPAAQLSERLGGVAVVLTRAALGAEVACLDGIWHQPADGGAGDRHHRGGRLLRRRHGAPAGPRRITPRSGAAARASRQLYAARVRAARAVYRPGRKRMRSQPA